jgi:hypothetical protein
MALRRTGHDHVAADGHGLTVTRSTPWRRLVALAAVVVTALVILLVVIYREGPDRTITGRITSVELHQVCVDPSEGADVCVGVDSPDDMPNVSSGECVRLRYSADDLLVSLRRTTACG